MKKAIVILFTILFSTGAAFADTASQLIACGINDVQASCFEDVMDASYGTLAAAGSTTADAALISKKITYVTATDNVKGVRFPTPGAGTSWKIFNTVASKNLLIYPVTGGTINGNSANAAVSIYGKTGLECFATSTSAFLCSSLNAPTTRTIFIPAGSGRAGTTAGWTNTGTNMNEALLPASQTTATFTIPVHGLQVGDTIVSFQPVAQIESAGNAASLTKATALRKLTNAAGDPVDAEVQAIAAISKTADYATGATDITTLGTADLVESGESFYFLVTGTTGASTGIRLLGFEVTVRRDN